MAFVWNTLWFCTLVHSHAKCCLPSFPMRKSSSVVYLGWDCRYLLQVSRHVQTTKTDQNLLTHLRQYRRIYDRDCKSSAIHLRRSWMPIRTLKNKYARMKVRKENVTEWIALNPSRSTWIFHAAFKAVFCFLQSANYRAGRLEGRVPLRRRQRLLRPH